MAAIPRTARRLLACASCFAFGASLPAQSPPSPLPVADGFTDTVRWLEVASPFGMSGVAPGLTPDELYFSVDNLLFRLDAQDLTHVEFSLPIGERVGVVARRPGSDELLFADATRDHLHVRDLVTGSEAVRPMPANTFDVVATATGAVLVSANPAWPAPGARTGIWLLDPSGGTRHREVIALDGPSGPLAIAPHTGDLIYATQSATFPTPPGGTRLLRFPAAALIGAIAGGPALSTVDAQVMATGLDGGYDLVFDDRGSLYVSDPQHGGVIRFLPDGRRHPVPLVATSGEATTALAFVDEDAATFDAFQTDTAGRLLVITADWTSRATVRELRPERPTIDAPFGTTAGPGAVRLVAAGLPPARGALWMASSLPALAAERAVLSVSGIPVWSSLDFQIPPITGWTTTDAQGVAQLDLVHVGGLGWQLTFAAVAATDPARGDLSLATTPCLSILLLP